MKTRLRFFLLAMIALYAGNSMDAQYASFFYSTNWECPPMKVLFTNTSDTVGLTGTVHFTWDIETKGTFDTIQPDTVVFDQGGEYFVRLTMWDDFGFEDHYETTMSVYPDPDYFHPADQSSFCPGEKITFHVDDNVGWWDIKWDFGDGSVPIRDDNYVDHAYPAPGSYQVELMMEHDCGLDTIVQTVHIADTATPVVLATVEGEQTICPNEQVSFNTCDIYESYHWDFGDGTSSNELNPTHFFAAQDSADYTVVLTATNICGNTGTDTLWMHIRDYGIVNAYFHIETNQGDNQSCPQSPVKFVPHFSAAAYNWDLGDGTRSNERSPVNYYGEPGWYYITLTAVNGCGDVATYLDSVLVEYDFEYTPYADFYMEVEGIDYDESEGDTLFVCPGELVEFNNFSCCDDLRYEWNFGDGVTAYSKNAKHVYSAPGTYSVTLYAYHPCGGYDFMEKQVWVDETLIPDVALGVTPDLICPGERVYFWDEEGNEGGRFHYDIWFGDGDSLKMLTTYTDSVLMTLASHAYTGVANDSFNYVFNVTNRCGNTLTKSGWIKITEDPAHKPFYYVENTTTSDANRAILDWGVRRDPTDHEFKIGVVWPGWPAYQNKFAIYFWYGGFDPFSDDDPGFADGYVEFTSDQIQTGDTVTAYIPIDPIQPPLIGLAGGWTCNGNYNQGIEPEVWGMQLDGEYQPVVSMPLTPYGFSDLPAIYGNYVILDADEAWDGLCADEKPKGHYSYQHSTVDYIQLEMYEDEESGNSYYLYASSDPEGDFWTTTISMGNYYLLGENTLEFDNGEDCIGTYSYDISGDSLTFSLNYDECSGIQTYLTVKPFRRQLDFGEEEDMSACVGDDVLFSVAGGVSYEWHFGDEETSTEQFPLHSYDTAGTYNAFVIATNACTRVDTIYTPVEISEDNLPRPWFWYEGYDYPRFEPIQFYWGDPYEDRAGNLSFLWDFGDGNTSAMMNPVHAYERDGEYDITLTVTNGCGSSSFTEYIWIRDADLACEAKFADSLVMGTDSVFFKDISRGIISSWFWEFGDGTTSNIKNPVHVFPQAGVYVVCLSVYDTTNDCATQFCREVIVGTLNCRAGFVYNVNDAIRTVQFTDRSSGTTEWFWDFGDGSDPMNEQNPMHTYQEPGLYLVCQTIFNPTNGCTDQFCMEVEVGASDSAYCYADFSFFVADDNSVRFTDQSSSNISHWYWTFGDGTYIAQRHPVHLYQHTGLYDVCLNVFDEITGSRAEICKKIPVGVSECNQNAEFSFFIDITNDIVKFTDKSTGTITSYFWDFGDGATSARRNPEHTYAEPGFYLVTLSVYDSDSECTDHTAKFLQIGTVDCRAIFEYQVDATTNNVMFYDKSKGEIEKYFWEFDDGTTSTLQHPPHLYSRPGLYNVSLTVVGASGICMDHYEEPVQVGNVGCAADFKYFVDSATNIGYFTPEAIGTITDYLWIFGDGSISTQVNPKHLFAKPGYYTVGLNTYDALTGCMDYYEEVVLIGQAGLDCRADYIFAVEPGTEPGTFDVRFKDRSRGDIDKWIWNFGDGSPVVEDQETPSHLYNRGGQYMVCLTVVNSSGIVNTYCDWVHLASQESESCFANFFYSVDSTTMTVSFADVSHGNPDTWKWNFGDSTALGTEQDPEYSYTRPGFYLVTLRIRNSVTGCYSRHSEMINVAKEYMGIQVGFDYDIDSTDLKAESYPVDFVGVALGDAAKFQWSFGDGNVDSTSMNPTHVYAVPGTYWVCITVWDPLTDSSSTDCDFVTVGGASTGFDPYGRNVFNLGNYPNPFDDITYIVYNLPMDAEVKLAVYDQVGRMVDLLVGGERQPAGPYRIEYKASGRSSGIYILRLIVDQGVYTSKMLLR